MALDAGICGGGDLCSFAAAVPRDHDAQWVDAAQLALTPPLGFGWSARIELELRYPNGARIAWDEVVPVEGATVDHVLQPPETAPAGLALLVAYVTYAGADGLETLSLGMGGQFVEAGPSGMLPTAGRFGAMMGVGLIDEPTERDEEVYP